MPRVVVMSSTTSSLQAALVELVRALVHRVCQVDRREVLPI